MKEFYCKYNRDNMDNVVFFLLMYSACSMRRACVVHKRAITAQIIYELEKTIYGLKKTIYGLKRLFTGWKRLFTALT